MLDSKMNTKHRVKNKKERYKFLDPMVCLMNQQQNNSFNRFDSLHFQFKPIFEYIIL